VNSVSPQQNAASFKVDYSLPLSSGLKLSAGMQFKKQLMKDDLSEDFRWEEETRAGYAALNFTSGKFDVQTGARYENSNMGMNNAGSNNFRALLPNIAASYKINTSQNLRFAYRGSLAYPHLYHLNPYQAVDDPFSIRSGNPGLKPENRQNISFEYSRRFEHSFIAMRLFYIKTTDAINLLTHINGNGVFETRPYNSGELHRYGIQFTGALTFGKTISFNPYLRFFEVNTKPNNMATEKGIAHSRTLAMESGLSAVASFKHDITASVMFQYATPVREMQRSYFSGALYFVSVEKAFGQGFKAGMVSGIPFSKSFIYQGYEIEAQDFHSRSEGVVRMSAIPLWFKFSYQFSTGKKRSGIDRATETYEQQRKGF
jgi:outer membrane receptor protein involved in Fe transport